MAKGKKLTESKTGAINPFVLLNVIPVRRLWLMHLWFRLIVIYDFFFFSCCRTNIEAISFQPTNCVLHVVRLPVLLCPGCPCIFSLCIFRSVIIMSNFICICRDAQMRLSPCQIISVPFNLYHYYHMENEETINGCVQHLIRVL